MSKPDDSSLKLIETIYRAALDPHGYDAFMGNWEDWVSSRVSALETVRLSEPDMTLPEIAAHFELALRLLERLGDEPATPRMKGPQILLDQTGQVLWQNAQADRLLGGEKGRGLGHFGMEDSHRSQLGAFLEGLGEVGEKQLKVVQIDPMDGGRPIPFRLDPLREGKDKFLALLTSLAPSWPEGADRLLMETHRLTAGECAICALLVDGLSADKIAKRRDRSVATVRTQIKRILSKTRQGSQTELQSYLFGLMRVAEDMPMAEAPIALPALSGGRVHDLTLQGRRIIVEEHGPRDGFPVVFMHGMLDGTGITRRMCDSLQRFNLRLICPHRPAFGRSEPLPCPPENALQMFGDDMRELLQGWGIERPVLLGHMAGSLYSYATAGACQARAIVIVSGGVPILSGAQFDAMTRRQRLVAYTARFAPSVLPFVVNAGIRQIKSGGEESFMRSLYEHAPVDLSVLEDADVRALVLEGYRFTIAQGHAAFVTDSYHVVRDWSPMFEATAPLPVHLIHGRHDHVVAPGSVQEFAQKYAGRVTLTMVQDAGQLVLYQNPELVLKTVAGCFECADDHVSALP